MFVTKLSEWPSVSCTYLIIYLTVGLTQSSDVNIHMPCLRQTRLIPY